MEKGGFVYFVYIVSNQERTVLCIGVTDDLPVRIVAHKKGEAVLSGCSPRCTDLLYYEHYVDMADASLRAEQLKKWSRSRKDELIGFNNPEWKDLYESVQGEGEFKLVSAMID